MFSIAFVNTFIASSAPLKEGFTLYFSPYNIQDEYAHFLVDVNDDFVKKMLMFEDVVRDKTFIWNVVTNCFKKNSIWR